MRGFTTFAVTLCLAATSSFAAQRYSGKLMDAGCYNSQKVDSQESGHKTYHDITKTCAATAATTSFAVRVTGSAYHADIGNTVKLDSAGNAMAMHAMQSGAFPADSDGDIHVRVRGDLKGETLINASMRGRQGKVYSERS